MISTTNTIIFIILSLPIVVLSRKYIFNPKTHGFYRFFSWECIILLFSVNYEFWFREPLTLPHLISWILLIVSVYLIIAGPLELSRKGKSEKIRNDQELFEFEKTTKIVDSGIYSFIRHPLYSSLLFLTWGICLKNINILTIIISCISTIFLFLTAIQDEKECLLFFGESYKIYMKKTRRFIPYLF